MRYRQFLAPSAIISLSILLITSSLYGQAHTKGKEVSPLARTLKPGDYIWHPEVSPNGPAYAFRNGIEIGRAPVNALNRLSGTYVYSALDTEDADGQREWISTVGSRGRAPNLKDVANQLGIPPEFDADLRALITPGTTLVLTNLPVNAGTKSAPGFDILTD